ncbi:MAG: hypothetical protein PVJ67_00105 [Candidatus Pacearchaeota archaeon]|jgi:hypothetical protein
MKKFSGGKWVGQKGQEYSATYNFHHDIYNCPEPGVSAVAHFSYSRGGYEGGGDVFLSKDLTDSKRTISHQTRLKVSDKITTIDKGGTRRRYQNEKLLNELMKIYDVQIQLRSDLPQEMKQDIIYGTIADVAKFCSEAVAKNYRGEKIEEVEKIIPRTQAKWVTPKRLLDIGKKLFVSECIYPANIDFVKGCQTSFIPGEDATYEGSPVTEKGEFKNWFFAPWGQCGYPCYAERHNNKPFSKTLHRIDFNELERLLMGGFCPEHNSDIPQGFPVEYLRFGKWTESWTVATQENFKKTLELMIKTKTKGIIPIKLLPFQKELVELFRSTNSVIPYSIGRDEYEQGAVLNECPNEYRVEKILEYRDSKVNAFPFLHIIANDSPTKRDLNYINFFLENKSPVLLLPLRFKTKEPYNKLSGLNWDIEKEIGRYHPELKVAGSVGHEMDHKWTRPFVHPDWLKMIKDNNGRVRMCHHNSVDTYCGKCFHEDGIITPTKKNNIIINTGSWKKRKKKEKPKKKISNEKDDIELFLERGNLQN